jgi:phytol kinase
VAFEFLKIICIFCALVVFIALVSAAPDLGRTSGELKRKIVHAGLGISTLFFPVFFNDTWSVFLLGVFVSGFFCLIRIVPILKRTIGKSLYQINRDSKGEFFFVLSVITLFYLSRRNLVLYVIPLLILTLCDSAAALVGKRFGRFRYAVSDGLKSIEGNIAFFCCSFLLIMAILWINIDLGFQKIILISILLSSLGTLLEAMSWKGFDNLLVPLGVYFLLKDCLTRTPSELLQIFTVFQSLIVLSLLLEQLSNLNVHGFMIAICSGFFFWNLGGWPWLAIPLLIFFAHILFSNIQKEATVYDRGPVLSVAAGGFFWLIVDYFFQINHALYFFSLYVTLQLQMMLVFRLQIVCFHRLVLSALFSTIIGFLCFFLKNPHLYTSQQGLFLFLFTLIISIPVVHSTQKLNQYRWLYQALIAWVGSLIGYCIIWIY